MSDKQMIGYVFVVMGLVLLLVMIAFVLEFIYFFPLYNDVHLFAIGGLSVGSLMYVTILLRLESILSKDEVVGKVENV